MVNRQLFLFLNHFLGTHPSTPVVLDGLFVLGKVVFDLDLGTDPSQVWSLTRFYSVDFSK